MCSKAPQLDKLFGTTTQIQASIIRNWNKSANSDKGRIAGGLKVPMSAAQRNTGLSFNGESNRRHNFEVTFQPGILYEKPGTTSDAAGVFAKPF